MSYEHIWVVIGVLALCAWMGLTVWARHLRDKKRMALREMIHRERMAALEKGVDLPELPVDVAGGAAETGDGPAWVGRAALLAGLTLVCAGIGMAAAFGFTPDTSEMGGMRDLAPLGLLPVFAGIGLLLFFVLDRRTRRPPGA